MAAYGCRPPKSLFAGLGCGLGYMRSLSVMHSTTEVAYADCYVVAKPLRLPFFLLGESNFWPETFPRPSNRFWRNLLFVHDWFQWFLSASVVCTNSHFIISLYSCCFVLASSYIVVLLTLERKIL